MAIIPIKFNVDGSIKVRHTEFNHEGIILETDIKFAKKLDGTDDLRFIILGCPVAGCNSESIHPASGGVDPEKVQKMFAKMYKKYPAKEKLPKYEKDANRTWDEAKVNLKKVVEEMDGPGRFKLEGVAEV
ncbi:MAG: hypothetical protein ACYC4H_12890 [Desulfocucumaceae bacterium]